MIWNYESHLVIVCTFSRSLSGYRQHFFLNTMLPTWMNANMMMKGPKCAIPRVMGCDSKISWRTGEINTFSSIQSRSRKPICCKDRNHRIQPTAYRMWFSFSLVQIFPLASSPVQMVLVTDNWNIINRIITGCNSVFYIASGTV